MNTLPILHINTLGTKGDGISSHQDKKVVVPYSLPGEEVEARVIDMKKESSYGVVTKVVSRSDNRVIAPCRYFTICGGCKMQHMNEKTYYGFKESLAMEMLARLGVSLKVLQEMVRIGMRSRRRMQLKVHQGKDGVKLGFYKAKSHQVVDIDDCLVSDASLCKVMTGARKMIAELRKGLLVSQIDIGVCDNGVDMLIRCNKLFNEGNLAILNEFALQYDLLRIAVAAEGDMKVVYEKNPPKLGPATIPPASFMQATTKGQDEITKRILREISAATKVLDLFCGIGTYSFPIAGKGKEVMAIEGDGEMVKAVHNAALDMPNLKSAKRDLFKNPLSSNELNDYDLVVINPPRVGAKEQVQELSKSNISKIIMVSCSLTSFERDSKTLLQSGYTLTTLTPLDQFFMTHHLEVIGVFITK